MRRQCLSEGEENDARNERREEHGACARSVGSRLGWWRCRYDGRCHGDAMSAAMDPMAKRAFLLNAIEARLDELLRARDAVMGGISLDGQRFEDRTDGERDALLTSISDSQLAMLHWRRDIEASGQERA